jgi:tRNA threonylcarbamoyladenosine biosynthesis protein TsaE
MIAARAYRETLGELHIDRETVTCSPAQTAALGASLTKYLRPGDVVALYGDLGSGKTCFSQGVGKALGITEPMPSPTFTLINEYEGALPVYHLDFYRLDTLRQLSGLGLEEYFYDDGVCLVEWPERGEELLPLRRINVRFSLMPEHTTWRQVIIEAQ